MYNRKIYYKYANDNNSFNCLLILANSFNFILLTARQTKNLKLFCLAVLRQYTLFFVLQHRLFNLTPNMLEVGHPKRSFVNVTWRDLDQSRADILRCGITSGNGTVEYGDDEFL